MLRTRPTLVLPHGGGGTKAGGGGVSRTQAVMVMVGPSVCAYVGIHAALCSMSCARVRIHGCECVSSRRMEREKRSKNDTGQQKNGTHREWGRSGESLLDEKRGPGTAPGGVKEESAMALNGVRIRCFLFSTSSFSLARCLALRKSQTNGDVCCCRYRNPGSGFPLLTSTSPCLASP